MKIVEIAPMAVSAKKAMDLKKIATTQATGQKTNAQGTTGTVGTVKPGDTIGANTSTCLLYTSPSPRDRQKSRMPSSA